MCGGHYLKSRKHPIQNLVCISRLMIPHTFQDSMKSCIIMNFLGRARQASQGGLKIALKRKETGSVFIVIGGGANVMVPRERKEVDLFDSPKSG